MGGLGGAPCAAAAAAVARARALFPAGPLSSIALPTRNLPLRVEDLRELLADAGRQRAPSTTKPQRAVVSSSSPNVCNRDIGGARGSRRDPRNRSGHPQKSADSPSACLAAFRRRGIGITCWRTWPSLARMARARLRGGGMSVLSRSDRGDRPPDSLAFCARRVRRG